MKRDPVTSSALLSVGYDRSTLTLELEVTGGRVYQYFDVSESVYLELMSSSSKGHYYNQHIRNAYQCRLL